MTLQQEKGQIQLSPSPYGPCAYLQVKLDKRHLHNVLGCGGDLDRECDLLDDTIQVAIVDSYIAFDLFLLLTSTGNLLVGYLVPDIERDITNPINIIIIGPWKLSFIIIVLVWDILECPYYSMRYQLT